MIPSRMKIFLSEHLNEDVWEKSIVHSVNLYFMEFNSTDVELLANLRIVVDTLGPYRVVYMWEDVSHLEICGYLVVDNIMMGKPSLGGIRCGPPSLWRTWPIQVVFFLPSMKNSTMSLMNCAFHKKCLAVPLLSISS